MGIGIITVIKNGNELKLVKSDDYKIQYNFKADEYYLLTCDYEVPLKMFVPSRCESLRVKVMNNKNELIEKTEYFLDDYITLETKIDNSYYIVEAKYKNGDVDKLKIFVYLEKSGE